jgi:hypothetical protein
MSRWLGDRLAEGLRTATIASLHRRVANVRLDRDRFVSVGAPEVPLAANGLTIDLAPPITLEGIGLRPGQAVRLDPGALRVPDADMEIDLGAAVSWDPRPPAQRVGPTELARRARAARAIAVAEGDGRSLLALLWWREEYPDSGALARAAARPALRLRSASLVGDTAGVERAARGLAGLGPGLTPSGDDYLAGFAAAWALASESLGRDGRLTAAVLDSLWVGAAPGASELGRAWIAHAVRGEVAEPLGRFLTTLLGPESAALHATVRGVLGLGATSGADWMAGALAATDAALTAEGEAYLCPTRAYPHHEAVRPDQKETIMANPFVHVELNTTDVAKAKAFYGKLFDWKLEDMPMPGGSYTMIHVGEGTGGGLMKHPVPGAPSAWLAYVLVDDIAAATKKAKSLGATVMKDVTEVTGAGWLSIIIDPTGAALGLWKPKSA